MEGHPSKSYTRFSEMYVEPDKVNFFLNYVKHSQDTDLRWLEFKRQCENEVMFVVNCYDVE